MNSLGVLQTSMNVKKTRMLQKMGKEGRSYSEAYINAHATVKDNETVFKEEVKNMKKLISTLDAYEENILAFGTLLHDSTIKVKHTSTSNTEAWEYLSSIHKTLAGNCRGLRGIIQARMTDLRQFLDADLHATEKARANVQNAKVELDSAEDSLNSLTPNSSNNDILRIYGNHTKATEKFDKQYRDCLYMMQDVLTVKDHKIANAWAVTMQELSELIQLTFSQFDAFEKQMEALRAYEVSKIEEFDAIREARHKERTQRHMQTLRGLEDDLIQMLLHPDLTLIGAIGVASTGNEKIVQMIVKILDSYGKLVSLLTVAVTKEVTTTQDNSTLFRGNSPSTKLMTAFTRILGQGYLDTVLKPFVEDMIEDDPELYEVNPAKTKANVEENMQNLLKRCQQILDVILNSLDICPPSFRMVTKHLQREVVKRFPESKNTCVGGFLFLRFLCPVLMAPDALGLIKGPIDKNKKRPLVLICKALQNLSNNIRFGKKEQYMHPVNTFLDDNLDRTNKFFSDFVDVSDNIQWDPLTAIEDIRKNEVRQLHGYTKENIAKIGRYLLGTSPPELVMEIVRLIADLDSAYDYGDEHPELEKYYVPPETTDSLDTFSRQSRLSRKIAHESSPNLHTSPLTSSTSSPERQDKKSKSFAPPPRQRSFGGLSMRNTTGPERPDRRGGSSIGPREEAPAFSSSSGAVSPNTSSSSFPASSAPPSPAPPVPAPATQPLPPPSPQPSYELNSRASAPAERAPPPVSPRPVSCAVSASSVPPVSPRDRAPAPPPPVSPRPVSCAVSASSVPPAVAPRTPPPSSSSFSGRPSAPSRQPLLGGNRASSDAIPQLSRERSSVRSSARYAHPPNQLGYFFHLFLFVVLLFYCFIVLLFYCFIVLLFYCFIVLLFYCFIVLLFYCFIVLLFYCFIVLLF